MKGQPAHFDFSTFAGRPGLLLGGSAAVSGDHLQVAKGGEFRAGGAWYQDKLFVAEGFDCTFQVRVTGPETSKGFALVLHGEALPGFGYSDGLGYDGLRNSLALEFDFHQSPNFLEPPTPHVSLQTRGRYLNTSHPSASLGYSTNGVAELANGSVHAVRVRYVPGTLEVALNDRPSLRIDLELAPLLQLHGGRAWMGFTAGSSQAEGAVEILSWSFLPRSSTLQVALTGPAQGTEFTSGSTISLTASTATSTGSVSRVEFFTEEQKIGEAASAPFDFEWTNAVPGEHIVWAAVFDDGGHRSVSAPLRLRIVPPEPAIGINFAAGLGGTNFPLAAWDTAGLVRQSNWNNALPGPSAGGSLANVISSAGAATPVAISYQFVGSGEELAVNPETSPDHQLMRAYLADHGRLIGQTNGTITISGIPYPTYDLILYSDGGNNGYERIVEFSVGQERIFLRDAPWTTFSGRYAEARGTINLGFTTPCGNYVRFRGLTNQNATVVISERSSVDVIRRAAVNAIQIVPSIANSSVAAPRFVRGPYLQTGTPRSMTICWRTDLPTTTLLTYGTAPEALNLAVSNSTAARDHVVTLTNLQPNTRYYYSPGPAFTNLPAQNLTFVTSPLTTRPTRLWVWGDGGTADLNAATVRDSMLEYSGSRKPDLVLLLGDNAYQNGSDAEYQGAIFDMLAPMLSQTVLWSCMGNHETYSQDLPYLKMFHFPTNGEAGGIPSGSELYYSFDYANIHFVCVESTVEDRSSTSRMAEWLRTDLAAARKEWLIAYVHAPPYSKGSHDSDDETEIEMQDIRENIVPILEQYGVDLVLSGNSHNYERSQLIDGHYGLADTFLQSMIKQHGSGRPDDTGGYVKSVRGPMPHSGTVYVVAGHGGITRATRGLNHPAMFTGSTELGSVIIDVDGPTLEFRMLRENGTIGDYFTMRKGVTMTPRPEVSLMAVDQVLDESASAGTSILISRTDPGDEDIQVHYRVAGTAGNGWDYVRLGDSVVIPAGDTQVALPVVPFDDAEHEPDKEIAVTLSSNTAPFTVALLPNTGVYAAGVNGGSINMLNAQARWIGSGASEFNVRIALHAGDVTANNTAAEWERVQTALSPIAGLMPLGFALGERDGLASGVSDTGLFNARFLSSVEQTPGYGGAFEPNRAENVYHYFSGGGVDWLVLTLEFGPRDAVVAWANRLIARHPERKVMVLTHAQLAGDDLWHGASPEHQQVPAAFGRKNNGVELWHKLLRRHANIALVLSGCANDGSGLRRDFGDYGNSVVQLSTDFSGELNGGNGYLRLLDFNPSEDKVVVRNYSPYLNAERSRFEIPDLGLFKPYHARYVLQPPISVSIALQDNDADLHAPTVVSVAAEGETNRIVVTFSEAITVASAENINNYQISTGMIIQGARLLADGRTTVLTTQQALPEDMPVQLTISDIRDRSSPPNRMTSTTVVFQHRTMFFLDRFEDGDRIGWTIIDVGQENAPSIWSVPAGELYQSSEVSGTIAVWAAPTAFEWSDCVVKMRIKTPDPDVVGLVFRYRDANNFYRLELNARLGVRQLVLVSNGLERTVVSAPGGFPLNTEFVLELELFNHRIYATLDGAPIFDSVIASDALPRGTIGLYCSRNGGVSFDDVEVTPFRTPSFSVLLNPAIVPMGAFEFDLVGPAGARFAIESSPDLKTWSEVLTVTNQFNQQRFSVRASDAAQPGFYRARRLE